MTAAPAPKRVVTLIASATEIVAALGCVEWLVGRSHECDFPREVKSLPVLTEPKFAVEGSSYEIDARVKAIVQEGLSVYRVDAAALEAVQPDVIITQDHCEVCAVSLKDVEDALCQITGKDAQIVSLHPDRLPDLWAGMESVGRALGVAERAGHVITALQGRMDDIAHRAGALSARPRVACIEWIEPLMAGGNWMPELIEMAGGENLFARAGEHSPAMTWEALRAADPDVIFVQPCGFDISRTLQEMPELEAREGWGDVRAVREGRVIVTDGSQYFNRPGPRLAESLEILAEVLHPESFAFGHEGTGWVRRRGD
ncbi:MAG: cobalamin-binding protein [Hyphomicrobiales bacterium]|nr:cobalamin-binding protein [Hyphomicrobiales bacterium]